MVNRLTSEPAAFPPHVLLPQDMSDTLHLDVMLVFLQPRSAPTTDQEVPRASAEPNSSNPNSPGWQKV